MITIEDRKASERFGMQDNHADPSDVLCSKVWAKLLQPLRRFRAVGSSVYARTKGRKRCRYQRRAIFLPSQLSQTPGV